MILSNNLENKTPSDTNMKVQTCNSLEPPLGYNQCLTHLTNQGWLWSSYPTRKLQKYYGVSDYF